MATDELWFDLAHAILNCMVREPCGLSASQEATLHTITHGMLRKGWRCGRVVYFLRDSRTDLIKIGCSRDPWKVERRLQPAYGKKLGLIAVCPGGRERKRQLHWRFKAWREQGDWFRPSADVLAFIDQLRTPAGVLKLVGILESEAFFRDRGFDFWKDECDGKVRPGSEERV